MHSISYQTSWIDQVTQILNKDENSFLSDKMYWKNTVTRQWFFWDAEFVTTKNARLLSTVMFFGKFLWKKRFRSWNLPSICPPSCSFEASPPLSPGSFFSSSSLLASSLLLSVKRHNILAITHMSGNRKLLQTNCFCCIITNSSHGYVGNLSTKKPPQKNKTKA